MNTPLFGPDRPSDAYPLTDGTEVRAARRYQNRDGEPFEARGDCLSGPLGPEQFTSHEDYEVARELDEWGCNPFEGI